MCSSTVSYTHLDVYKRQLQRHQLRAPGQVLLLCVRQRAGRALEKALGVHIKQRKVEIHLGNIALVLGGMVRAEADGCLLYTSRCV